MTYQQKDMEELALSQVDRLATFILREVSGEPSQNEGAIDCAIRIIKTQQARIAELEKELKKERKYNTDMKEYFARFEPFKTWLEEDKTFGIAVQSPPKENEE